jgi:hypothetical protein
MSFLLAFWGRFRSGRQPIRIRVMMLGTHLEVPMKRFVAVAFTLAVLALPTTQTADARPTAHDRWMKAILKVAAPNATDASAKPRKPLCMCSSNRVGGLYVASTGSHLEVACAVPSFNADGTRGFSTAHCGDFVLLNK